MKNTKQSFGIVLAIGLICLGRSASFAQPISCHDTTANVLSPNLTFVLTLNDKDIHTAYIAEVRMVPNRPSIHGLGEGPAPEPPAAPAVKFFQGTASYCYLAEVTKPSSITALTNEREVTDPALKARLRQALSDQLALYRNMVLQDEKK